MSLLLPVLVACGGGAGGGGNAAGSGSAKVDLSASQYFPTQVGNRWIYQSSRSVDPVIVRLTGQRSVSGLTGVAMLSSDPIAGESVLVEDAQGVREFPGNGADPLTLALGPVQLLRYPLLVGDSFVAADKALGAVVDFDGDGVRDSVTVRADTQVLGLEVLDTALGKLTDCLHLRTTALLKVQTSGSKQTVTLSSVSDDWLAPGIGKVRSDVSTSGGGVNSTSSQLITGYGVAGRRSETLAPTASAPVLASAAVLGPTTMLEIAFSEAMDGSTLAGALKVLDASGKPVAGTVSVGASSVQFRPSAGWASGSYSAQISTAAQDLVGNPLAAAQTWPFTIDATPPTLLQSTPLQGSIDVPLASNIVVTFSEAVAPASVGASTITLLYDGAVLSTLDYAVNGASVTLTPKSALARGKTYSLHISGVTDLVGNPMSGATVSFTSDPGRFGTPVALAPATAVPAGASPALGDVVAVGDLDGDGRADVVATSVQWQGSYWRNTLLVYYQQADGRLSTPLQIDHIDNCPTTSMQIGDIDGSGHNALIVTSCGIDVVVRAADGTLSRRKLIDSPGATRLQLADMNGDGRLDLVTYDYIDNLVRVWLNRPDGWSRVDAPTLPSFPQINSLAVGDLNGDGRPDIAISGAALPGFNAAALLYQKADGSFSAPSYLHVDGNEYASGVNIADLNGDGRADLVLALPSSGIAVHSQAADGSLGPLTRLSKDLFPSVVTLADINGDSRPDILAWHPASGLAVMLQQTDRSFSAAAQYPQPNNSAPSLMVVADLNGDGRPDLLLNGQLWLQRPVLPMAQLSRPARPAAAAPGLATRLRQALQERY